jgi:uncharacterized protein YcbK (DUF882 family)
MNDQLTPHFSLDELRCGCRCGVPGIVLERLERMAETLEVMRARLGRPISIISGYRCAARNKRVGGAPASRHLWGDAVDLQVAGMTGLELRALWEQAISAGDIPDGGLGTYADRPSTLHYDQRKKKARWHHGQR